LEPALAPAPTDARLVGSNALRVSNHAWRALSQFWMGRAGDLLQALPRQLRDIERSNNLYTWLWHKLIEGWAMGCCGRFAEAPAACEEVRKLLHPRALKLHRWHLEFGEAELALLESDPDTAWRGIEQFARKYRFMLLGQSQRVSLKWARANAVLNRAAHV